jgi:membrane protein
LLQGAQHANHGLLATFVGIVMLLFGASSVVIELRDSLNTVWDVAVTPTTGLRGLVHMLRERLFSFVLVLAAGFLLLVSMLVNAGIAALGPLLNEWFPISEVALHLVSSLVSLVIIAILFGAIFKVMPDARLEWADVFAGALVSSFLFTLGKVLIALYLGKAGFASAYGAAASVVIFVAWVYYSAQIFFFGAELVRGFAERYGSHQTKLP